MTAGKLAHLPDRGVVRVEGGDARHFLQGLITNEMAKLSGPGDAIHAALLSPQGKILFDFFVVQTADGFVLETVRDQVASLVKRLSLYKLRAEVSIADQSDDYLVMAQWDTDAASSAAGTGRSVSFADPRETTLGTRILVDAAVASNIDSAADSDVVSTDAYHAHRISVGVPEGGRDYLFADTYPHEADFDLFNGVSFTKGCYVGQEIVARMQNKSIVRKRVVAVTGAAALTSGRDVTIANVTIGRIGSVADHNALALIRLDRAADAVDSGGTIEAGGIAITVSPLALNAYRRAADANTQ